ncbi:MAG: tripartite tricarboxylate transporter substrate binding protein [Burkholderiales bacterium]|nr:tripartite tricarboxylate transporter substrate binding protein [Burkholderiales bacterium]
MNPSRRQILAAGLAGLGCAAPGVRAQSFPSAPIKFVIPTAPGGGHDTMMRLIGQKLTERLGQPCVVESKAGASGGIAATTVAQANPDGHTLMLGYSAFLSNTVLMQKLSYRVEDFAPISMLALTPIALGISETLPATTLRHYVALAKTRPGQISYASYGQGSGGHFVGELFNMAAGLNTVHVPYKGEAPALMDVLAGQVQAAFVSIGGVKRYPGRIRPLAVASAERSPSNPEVPTFAELGYPEVDMPGWAALFAPAKTPPEVMQTLTREINRIVVLPEVKGKLAELGFDAVGWEPPQVQSFFKEQLARTRKLVDSNRVKL